ATTQVISPAEGTVQGWKHYDKGESVRVDVPLSSANPEDYDALMLPGGVANPDQLRMLPEAVAFVRAVVEAGEAIAAICHGPWRLIVADAARGRKVRSWPAIGTALTNAGARWCDEEVVTDRGLVTRRKPADLPAVTSKMTEESAKGSHSPSAMA